MKTLRLLLILSLFSAWVACHSQDPHFSHIHASPLNNNPAWTGVFNDNFRLITNYRNQWKSPTSNFNTFNVSFDARFVIPRTRMTLNGGMSFMNDSGGDLKFGTNNYNFMAGTTFPIGGGGRNFVTLGAQLGFIDNNINLANVQAIDDDPLLQSIGLKKKSMDVSAGIGYFLSLDETRQIYAGVAMYHINAPDVSLLENANVQLYRRWVANVGANWGFKKFGIQPGVILYWQGPHREITPGSYFYVQLRDRHYGDERSMKLYAGLWARYYIETEYNSGFDALIFSTRYDLDKLSVGVSFDITLSQLAEASTIIGSPEISVIYTFSMKEKNKTNTKNQLRCPAF